MMKHQTRALRLLEGRQVSVAVHGGTRLDGCQLVSAGRARVDTLWLFTNGQDVFIPCRDVIDVWETNPDGLRAA